MVVIKIKIIFKAGFTEFNRVLFGTLSNKEIELLAIQYACEMVENRNLEFCIQWSYLESIEEYKKTLQSELHTLRKINLENDKKIDKIVKTIKEL